MNKKVGIIVVNYKDYANKYLADFYNSLKIQTYPADLVNYYVIDNASSSASFDYLKTNFPEAKILPRTDGNYCAANTLGIQTAIKDNCELFVIVNMDTICDKNWLMELIKPLETDQNIGIVQSLILLADQPNKINSTGNVFHYLGFGFTDNYQKDYQNDLSLREIKGYASGCSFVITKEVIDKIGFYNDELYMYHDDVDISLRVKLAGYKIILNPKSIIYHKYEFNRSIRMVYFMERNRYLTILSFYKIKTLILFLPMLFVLDLAMLAYSLKQGWFKQKIKIYWYFLQPKTWQKIIQNRKFIKKIKILKDKELLKDFKGRVLFQEIENPVLKYVGNPLMAVYLKIAKIIIFW